MTGTGDAALILAEARRSSADLLIKTARPDDESRGRVFSSVAARLLRESPCPVWITRARTEVPRPIVLAAISPQHEHASMEAIDAEVLDVANQLAQLRDAELHVVSVWRADAARLLRGRVPGEDLRAYLRECEGKAGRDLRVFLSRSGCLVPASRLHVRRGNAAEVISRTAEDVEAELVVVGSAGRRGLTRWLLRNTAEDVLAQTERPVLGVRALEKCARSA